MDKSSGGRWYGMRPAARDLVWDSCEIFTFFDIEEGVWKSVYYHYDQDAIGHSFPSHSERLFFV